MNHKELRDKADESKTNITPEVKANFDALASGKFNNFCLFSCFVNDEPTAAICAVTRDKDGHFEVNPLFVAVTPNMKLTDHDNHEPDGVLR